MSLLFLSLALRSSTCQSLQGYKNERGPRLCMTVRAQATLLHTRSLQLRYYVHVNQNATCKIGQLHTMITLAGPKIKTLCSSSHV